MTIVDRIGQQKGLVVTPVSGFISKSRKVDSAIKVAPRPISPTIATDSSAEKGKSVRMGSYEKSTEFGSEEFPEVYMLLKADLLEDVNPCAKFVDNVEKVIRSLF